MLVYKHIPYIVTLYVIDKIRVKELFVFYLIVAVSDLKILYKKRIINYLFLYFVNSYDFVNYISCVLFISLCDDFLQSIYVFMSFLYYFYSSLYLDDLVYYKCIIALLSIMCNVRLQISFVFLLKTYILFSIEKIITLHNYIIGLEILHNICNCLFLIL